MCPPCRSVAGLLKRQKETVERELGYPLEWEDGRPFAGRLLRRAADGLVAARLDFFTITIFLPLRSIQGSASGARGSPAEQPHAPPFAPSGWGHRPRLHGCSTNSSLHRRQRFRRFALGRLGSLDYLAVIKLLADHQQRRPAALGIGRRALQSLQPLQ